MTWKLQQSHNCSRGDTANENENVYSLTPVINHDHVIFSQIKVLLQHLFTIMQTNNQQCITQILLINTKGTVLCIINHPWRFSCSKITVPEDMVHPIKTIKVLKVSSPSCCPQLLTQLWPDSKKWGVLCSMGQVIYYFHVAIKR